MIIAFITHNRLEYTKIALESVLATKPDHARVVIVDNASTDGTVEWLESVRGPDISFIFNADNLYPGKAANQAWEHGLELHPEAQTLVRIDNDCRMMLGWAEEVDACFEAHPFLGQLGLMNMGQSWPGEENRIKPRSMNGKTVNVWWTSIGGPCAIRRELWEMGIRYNELPWHSNGQPTPQEDVKLSLAIRSVGYYFANMIPHLCEEMSFGNTCDHGWYEYYEKTFTSRGHAPPARTLAGSIVDGDGKPVEGSHGTAPDHI